MTRLAIALGVASAAVVGYWILAVAGLLPGGRPEDDEDEHEEGWDQWPR